MERMMSLYNLMNGVTPATFFVLPMLGKHPDEYPRFRDCFLGDVEHPEYNDHIHVFTRTGGGNREEFESENNAMRAMPDYVTDFDDSSDCTYASWIFRVPDRWKADFEKYKVGNLREFSEEYRDQIYRVYPNLRENLDEFFK